MAVRLGGRLESVKSKYWRRVRHSGKTKRAQSSILDQWTSDYYKRGRFKQDTAKTMPIEMKVIIRYARALTLLLNRQLDLVRSGLDLFARP